MLVAEVVAARCGRKLEFGGWEGTGDGLQWARAMREWQPDWLAVGFQSKSDANSAAGRRSEGEDNRPDSPLKAQTSPAPARTPDSDDDSLHGYDSPTSSRSPSPTPSELAEIEKDPTLRVSRPKPVARPVYIAQLAILLRAGGTDDEGAAEKIEMGLTHAEGLVRRKKGFGMELGERKFFYFVRYSWR
jgi:telomere length regulation protein